MDFRYKPAIRIISLVTLLFFCWTFGGIFDIAYAIKNSDKIQVASSKSDNQRLFTSNQQSNTPKPAETFQKIIEDIEKILTDTSTDTDTKKNKLKTKRSEIEGLDTTIKKNFSDTEGSLKGGQQTLLEKAGNDFDQVSLLISLLRTSNIPARYVYGTAEIPVEDIKNWLGIDDTNMALTALASSGIPLTAITSGGAVSAVRLEHVWCQAFVSYGSSRGALEGSGDMWIDLDPSFKSTYSDCLMAKVTI